jgi:4-hydroxy-3-methylbut-2-enyl diphosphate reductase
VKVEIDDKSGFCFGVVNAISKAEAAAAGGRLFSLGDIVHNGAEMARLAALGLEVVAEDTDLASLAGRTVLVRAHGEPPATYDAARRHDITLVDATCPVVAQLQKTVAGAYREMAEVGGQVAIFGQRGHAEVRGLVGQSGNGHNGHSGLGYATPPVEVIENEADLARLDFSRPIYFLAQTTSSLPEFNRLAAEIRRRSSDTAKVTTHDTVCRQVAGREEHLAGFARRHDAIVFVAGAKSSNGRVLFDAVKNANPRSHKIEHPDELRPEWLTGAQSVGVCGATSTPRWLMEQVAGEIRQMQQTTDDTSK